MSCKHPHSKGDYIEILRKGKMLMKMRKPGIFRVLSLLLALLIVANLPILRLLSIKMMPRKLCKTY